ncbi:MAG: hypothetical protein ABL872_02580 [Lacibacter sp.]
MEWQSHFQTAFFETWRSAGLPHHDHFLSAYYTMLEQRDKKIACIENSAGIDHNRLYDVYGFGVTVGKVFGEMFGLTAEETKHSSDWCGRFNLGISLFDYISDEQGGAKSITSLKVFQPFNTTNHSDSHSLTPSEGLLSSLAETILSDVKKSPCKVSLLKAMQQMFEAEDFISTTKLSADADLDKINNALYLKSAEPFRVMAEYTAGVKTATDPLLLSNALAIGKAIGYCYWMIDDAKDVWIDLEAGHWNLFLHSAATEDADIFAQQDADTKNRLLNIWEQSGHAQKISGQIVKRLVDAVEKMELPVKVREHSLGIVSASLWQWYHS